MIRIIKNVFEIFKIYISRTDWKSYYFSEIKKNKLNLSFNEIYKNIYKENNGLTIFDVGANIGQTVERMKRDFNLKEMHCFEPNVKAFQKLKKYSSNKIIVNNFALGNKEYFRDFYNYPKSSSSSFFKINKKSSIYEINQNYHINKIQIKKLDDYTNTKNINKINILKIDTQGFEVEVLSGAENLIKEKKIDFIETEVNLGFQYENKTSFLDIENLLFDNYVLVAIKESGNVISNYDFQTNVIYANKDITNDI